MSDYDVVVIGCGPGGERAAVMAARAGKRVAVLEKHEGVGGTSVNWGTIPSKTLRESALFVHGLTRNKLHGIHAEIPEQISVADFMYRERYVVQQELKIANRLLDKYQIEVFQGRGQFLDLHRVALVGDRGQTRMTISGDLIVIATGTSPSNPPDVPFDGQRVFDSDSILSLPRMPRSMLVLGAGVIGVEYASIFAALGLEVTLLDTRSRLLPYLDREIAGVLERELRRLGVAILHDDRADQIQPVDDPRPGVRVTTRGRQELEADVLLYCVGRDGNTDDLGLENVDIQPTSRGLIEVNEFYQTRHAHIYAVGDVIGYPALASTSMEQGRQAIRHALKIPGPMGKTEVLPFAIYAIPEVSYCGETEDDLKGWGVDYVVGRAQYSKNPRGQIIGDVGGEMKLLFDADSMVLLGAHLVGMGASELIHTGLAFLRFSATATQIAETLYNYPTLSDLYRHAAYEALSERRKRKADGADPE